ncbi:hybrid sensor histidine kinase/response regulator, partial [Methylobacterium sp. J-070]|nr:hybrid sensor histidine kinase/response regulator [Methylobacterium sp. J-070]
PGLLPTRVEPGQPENALLQLCINPRDATPDGGRITIETANKWLERPPSTKHASSEGQSLSVCVTDPGTGMTPEVAARGYAPVCTH